MMVIVRQKPEKIQLSSSHLRVLAPKKSGVSFERALLLAERAGAVIASNKRLDKALIGSDEWRERNIVSWCWSGTMTAYVEHGRRLGRHVEYVDPNTHSKWVFVVPDRYKGERNGILVTEYPDYTLERDGNNRVVHATSVSLLHGFPAASSNFYLIDSKHGIPLGQQADRENEHARLLVRINRRVGPVARAYRTYAVDLSTPPSTKLGAVVRASKADVATISPVVLTLTRHSGRLIVEGTNGQLEAAVRLLRQLKSV